MTEKYIYENDQYIIEVIYVITLEKLDEFYLDEIPEYITDFGPYYVVIKHADVFDEITETTITMEDLCNYYAYDARDILSGCRSLSTFTGDWRMVDALAQEMHELFKFCCRNEYRDMVNTEYGEIMSAGW